MNYIIDRRDHIPAYIQLYRHLKADIAADIYPHGSKLPSKRTIAADTGMSLITVEHALALLIEEGYIEARPRSGYLVIYRSADFRQMEPERGPGTVVRGAGRSGAGADAGRATACRAELYADTSGRGAGRTKTETELNTWTEAGRAAALHRMMADENAGPAMPYGEGQPLRQGSFPFSVLSRTMRRVILDSGDRILTRSPNQGCPELRQEISAYLARSRGIRADAAQVVIGSGAEYLYGLAAQLLGRGRHFGLENPSYGKIRQVYESMGVMCDMLEMSGEGIMTSELERTDASVLHVTPFNSYPTGITAGISKRMEYLSWARERKGVIIEDNYDSELTVSRKAEEPLFMMSHDVDVIYINTFSKTIAPSMRIGYMVLPERLMREFNERLGFYSCTVPVFEQYVIAELLSSGDFERHINREKRRRRREAKLNSENR